MNSRLPSSYKFLSLVVGLIFYCSNLFAVEAEWQLGAGVGAFDFRLYPGSRQTTTYVLPLPYFTFHSQHLEIDRGIRGIFFTDPNSNWYFDLSADFGLPVNSDDSSVRTGMPDLDTILQIGPSLQRSFIGSRNAVRELRLELPVRMVISVDANHLGSEGWIFDPRLVYEKHRVGHAGLAAKASLGLRYATQDYHSYYYDVTSADVTPQRPVFESTRGYSGFVADLSVGWRKDDVLFWAILRYQNISNAVYENSPLVEDDDYYFIGVGVTWILAASH